MSKRTGASLRSRVGRLHTALADPDGAFEAESRLAFVGERLRGHLRPRTAPAGPVPGPGVAQDLRDLLDERLGGGITLAEAARLVHAHPAHLVRAFSAAYAIAPHQYLTSRRVDRARRLLLDGVPTGEAAAAVGFHDQSHLIRHFERIAGTTPGRYARSRGGRGPS